MDMLFCEVSRKVWRKRGGEPEKIKKLLGLVFAAYIDIRIARFIFKEVRLLTLHEVDLN